MNHLVHAGITFLLIQPALGQLSDIALNLADYIDAQLEEAIELLIEVVNINSGTQNFSGVQAVG